MRVVGFDLCAGSGADPGTPLFAGLGSICIPHSKSAKILHQSIPTWRIDESLLQKKKRFNFKNNPAQKKGKYCSPVEPPAVVQG